MWQTNGEALNLIDPATGVGFSQTFLSTLRDVDAAVEASTRALNRWGRTDWQLRQAVLRKAAESIRADVEAIAAALTQEQGKPLRDSRIEVLRCADTFAFYATDTFAPEISTRALPHKRAWVITQPVGVVAAIVPWNFPLTLMANKLVPALAAGNTVVVKPAATTPRAVGMVLDHLATAGLPDGVVKAVLGFGDVGEALVRHPDVSMISFTGSTRTGRLIMAAAADRVKRLALELGGSDPLILAPDGDVAGAAKAAAVGRYFNCGQACVAVKRAYVHQAVYDEFVDRLKARIDRLVVGDGRAEGVMMGPQHTAQQQQHTTELIDDALHRGANIVRGNLPADAAAQDGFFVAPTLLTDVPEGARVLHEESRSEEYHV